jgi:enoyl-CoA hydratase/carnithine racemase
VSNRPDGPQSLQVERPSDGVVALWLNRPDRRNALDGDLVRALREALAGAPARAVVIGSADPASFCAGADLRMDDAERAEVSDLLYELYGQIVRLSAPVIAAVDGPAVGGGAQLAIAADLRIGSPAARFRFAGPGHGLAVGAWGLPSLVGRGRAMDLCLSMRTVAGEEAHAIGLLDRLEDDPRAAALALAGEIAALRGDAVSRVKAIAREATGLLDALRLEREGNRRWSGSIEGLVRRPEAP